MSFVSCTQACVNINSFLNKAYVKSPGLKKQLVNLLLKFKDISSYSQTNLLCCFLTLELYFKLLISGMEQKSQAIALQMEHVAFCVLNTTSL